MIYWTIPQDDSGPKANCFSFFIFFFTLLLTFNLNFFVEEEETKVTFHDHTNSRVNYISSYSAKVFPMSPDLVSAKKHLEVNKLMDDWSSEVKDTCCIFILQ